MNNIKDLFIKHPLRVLIILLLALGLKEIIYTTTFNQVISPIADGYSESNTIRGSTSFIEEGITHFSGLPDTCYKGLLGNKGRVGYYRDVMKDPTASCEGVAYIHYPPGPEYMGWAAMIIFGKENYTLLRLLPIGLSLLVGYFFITTCFSLVGGGKRGLAFGLMLLLPPMYSNYFHGLHHQQYAFLMLQVQMILAIKLMTSAEIKKIWVYLAFIVLGFSQGYMTFDYAFLATLFVIPFYLYFREDKKVSILTLVYVGLASGISYTLAHALHFYQVIRYLGDFKTALHDFLASANHRATNSGDGLNAPHAKYDPNQIGPFTVMKDYLWRVSGRGKYLAINLINFIWIILGLRFIKRIEFKRWSFTFDLRNSDIAALIASVIISSLWSIVMKQHAHVHGFIARHYYFCYFFCCLILITRTKKEAK